MNWRLRAAACVMAVTATACAGTGFDPATVSETASTGTLAVVNEEGTLTETPQDEAGQPAVEGDATAGTGTGPDPALDGAGNVNSATGSTVQVGSLPFGVTAGAGLIWVANSGMDQVALLDPQTRRVVANIGTGPVTGPRSIAVGDKWAVVANTGDRSVSLIDVALRVPGPTISVGEDPVDVVIVENEAWVANALGNSVSIVNLDTQAVDTMFVGMRPEGITFGSERIFVSNLLDNNVTVIDRATRIGLVSIPTGRAPGGILHHDGQVFVSNGQDGTITVIGSDSLTVLATISVFGEPAEMTVGPNGLIWVTQLVGGRLMAIDPVTYEIVKEESLGTSSGGIASINGELWVSNADEGSVTVLTG